MEAYFVRIGSAGQIFTTYGEPDLNRADRVLVRTQRGVELGSIVSGVQPTSGQANQVTSTKDIFSRIIRPTTAQDEMLIHCFERHKRQAIESCRQALVDAGSKSVLLDMDPVFDSDVMLMHFLGPVDSIAESISKQIGERYAALIGVEKLSRLMLEGCGKDCGENCEKQCDAESSSQGCGGCAGCDSTPATGCSISTIEVP